MKKRSKVLAMLLACTLVLSNTGITASATETATVDVDSPVVETEALTGGITTEIIEQDPIVRAVADDEITIKDGALTDYDGPGGIVDLSDKEFTSVGKSCFYNKDEVVKVILPETVTAIGESAFLNSSNLLSVTIDSDQGNLQVISNRAFENCPMLTEIPVLSNVTAIGKTAFKQAGLTAVTIPAGCVSIGDSAFYQSKLKEVTFEEGDNPITIGMEAFQGCSNLKTATLSNRVTIISENMFNGSALESVSMPESCESIGEKAFYGTKIKSITIPASCIAIGEKVFYNCSALATVTFAEGNTLTSIGENMFYGTVLSSINIPETCESIGAKAFYGTKISNITIPATCTTIGDSAFYSCDLLSTVTFAEGSLLSSIGQNTFYNCNMLKNLRIPANCLAVGNQAFRNCNSLSTLEFENPNTAISSSALNVNNSTKEKMAIYAEPGGSVETFATENGIRFNRFTETLSITSEPIKTEYLYGENLDTEGLVITADYTSDTAPATEELAPAKCIISGFDSTSVGTQTISVTYGGKTATFDVNVYYDMNEVQISGLENATYTGEPIEQNLTLKNTRTNNALREDHYEISYSEDHTNAGTATVIVTGKGVYKGTRELDFEIYQKQLKNDCIRGFVEEMEYTGEQLKPEVAVYDGTKLLTEEDYILSYGSNVEVGTGTVKVEGMGNYTGTVNKQFTINAHSIANANIIVSSVESIYDTPTVTVMLDDKRLTEGTDYDVYITKDSNTGIIYINVTGRGNYKGSCNKEVITEPISVENAIVSIAYTQCAYDGTAKQPQVSSVIVGGKTLSYGKDYIVFYQNNTDIGTATVVVNGMGIYKGSVNKNFTIEAVKGMTIAKGSYKYTFTSSTEVALAGVTSGSLKKVDVASTVQIGGKTFNITSIADKAFYGNKKITSVNIGANVLTIGKSAFQNCKKLKKITITSNNLKKVGKAALKGIHAKAKIKVPAKKLKAYTKKLKGKGQGKGVKITK